MEDTEDLTRIKDAERALTNVHITEGCWQWTGSMQNTGYGYFNLGDEKISAHRWMYELVAGPIPDGLVLDHLCRNRACVRPSHLEPVTNRENILRGIGPTAVNATKTQCPKGHVYSVSTTGRGARGSRYCRVCHRERARVAMARSREQSRSARPCSVCGLPYAIKVDGTLYRHNGMDAAGFSTGEQCPGAGKPPRA